MAFRLLFLGIYNIKISFFMPFIPRMCVLPQLIKINEKYILKHNWTSIFENKLLLLLYSLFLSWSLKSIRPEHSETLLTSPSLLPHVFYHLHNFSNYLCPVTSASFPLSQPWCELPLSLTEIIMVASQLSFLSSASNRSNSSFKIGLASFSKSIPNHITFLFKPFSGSILIHCIRIPWH